MKSNIVLAFLMCSTVVGCASVAVNDDALQSRTSSALGLKPGEFVISNRVDSGMRTDYDVKAKNKTYSCYVTGTVSVVGRVVSDAMCTQTSGTASTSKPAGSNCNALLHAANKC